MIRPTIDQITLDPIPIESFPEEHEVFDELLRVTENEALDKNSKVTLISVPSKEKIKKFLKNLLSVSCASKEILVFCVILLRRLMHVTGWTLRATNWRPLVMIATNIALKFEGYDSISNQELHKMYPLFAPMEYFEQECLFLQLVDYHCVVTLDEFKLELSRLLKHKRSSTKKLSRGVAVAM
eukprot:CAMPEP_0115016232 /NCGR_PEP_ID=MMETSP0216-20121206/27298_1 /TAXON_ID=223996 /ORGANISM="Protocruzia adherens, Strain Boccale" /LENGTH=181 /DNA_ID=CAMNT_0002386617 /DNA_START=225 /DNA_END=770 /DNA_ORIENTATION=+